MMCACERMGGSPSRGIRMALHGPRWRRAASLGATPRFQKRVSVRGAMMTRGALSTFSQLKVVSCKFATRETPLGLVNGAIVMP